MSTTLYSAKYSGSSPDSRMLAACMARYSSANLSNSTSSITASDVSIRDELHTACRDELAYPRALQRIALGRPGILPVAGGPHVLVSGVAHELDRAGGRQGC